MSGIGNSTVALSTPFGIGTPDDATPPPTIAPQGARFMDPVTKDYVVGPDGEYLRMPTMRQRVLLALGTIKTSSSVQQDAGITLPTKIDGSYERRVQFSVKSALAFMVSSGELRVDQVSVVESRPGRSDILVAFTDLTNGQSDQVTR